MGNLSQDVKSMTKRVGKFMDGKRPFNLFLQLREGIIQNITVSEKGWSGDKLFEKEEDLIDQGCFLTGRPVVKYNLVDERMQVFENDEMVEDVSF